MRLVTLAMVLFLTACSIAKPLDDAVTTAEQLVYYYDGDITTLIQNAPLSELEMSTIENSIKTANRIRTKFEKYKNNPSSIPNIRLLEIEYSRLKNSYVAVRQIAIDNREHYSEEVWIMFETFDIFSSELDVQYNQVVESVKMNEAITSTISLANSILRVAVLL